MSEFYTLPELSERCKLSIRTLERAISRTDRAKLPSYRVGSRRLVKAADYERWIEQFRDEPSAASVAAGVLARLR